MPTKSLKCHGCTNQFYGEPDARWCDACSKTLKPFTVALSAQQRRHVESLATIRSVTAEDIVREAVSAFMARDDRRGIAKEKKPRRGAQG